MTHVMLVGNPNCGKTTLFNVLTGDNQQIGNWPGVTVEKKIGFMRDGNHTIQIMDLPGVYSLASSSSGMSQDEKITTSAIVDEKTDVIVNVVDACHLERHLYLTSQLLELGVPLILVLNMSDIASQRGIRIDVKTLSEKLHCPIVEMQAHRQIGIDSLKEALLAEPTKAMPFILNLPTPVEQSLKTIQQELSDKGLDESLSTYLANRALEGDAQVFANHQIHHQGTVDADIVLADARYSAVHQLILDVQHKLSDSSEHLTAKIDRIVLHRFWAIPIFFGVMYLMFLFAINLGGVFQPFFAMSTDALFVQGMAQMLNLLHAPSWVIALMANGVGKGINTLFSFIPVIAAMFFFLSLLELSGYMARAAFVVDKAMRKLGLPGKSFVPMIVGFGCNVPAIMAARTLDSERDRLLTILMSPFMSCSARLAIYSVFVAAFFPEGGQNIVFSLYLIGIVLAVLTGFLLRKTLFRGVASPLILELPAYHKPSFSRLVREAFLRLRYFIVRAAKLIIPVCVILGGLDVLTLDGLFAAQTSHESLLSLLGHALTPLFHPMGISQDNWPATVGLLTGVLAKEVVVGSLNTLYAQAGSLPQSASAGFDVLHALSQAVWSIPQGFLLLGQAFLNPILASAPDGELSQTVYGVMNQRFDGQVGAYAYLLFVLLYVPCVSTMAAIRQEASLKLMWFSTFWSIAVAYAIAVLFYQSATVFDHPADAIFWIVSMLILISVVILTMFLGLKSNVGGQHAVADS